MSQNTAKAVGVMNGLIATFDRKVKAVTPFYPQLCTIIPSTRAFQTYANLGDSPGVREWLGERHYFKFRAGTYLIENKHWESGVEVKKTDIDDDEIGLYPMGFETCAQNAVMHPDELLFEQGILGGTSNRCWDDQYFFDTDHAWGDSGTQSNKLEFAVADPDAPTALEFKDAFNYGRVAMERFKTDTGKLLNWDVTDDNKDLICVVPSELHQTAANAFQATVIDSTTNVVINVPRIKKSARLTSKRVFYLANVSMPLKPFMFQARMPLKRGYAGLDDMRTKFVQFMTEARYALGYGPWWTMVMITFTQAPE